ncbi:rplT [Gossypium arboreum]|uniref:RplT n=1 Tax=Gossypium arboreum TaxID=29729 RepID=A0A0B0NGR0_GOSAR|nr:rplT [Gossypium arboreum]
MRKSSDGAKDALQRHIVYSFGDHYYFRKEFKILNLLTGMNKFTVLRDLNFVAENLGVEFFKGTVVV